MSQPAKIEEHDANPVAAQTPMEMLSVAISGGANVDLIDRLMTLHERWEANQGRKEFDEAISKASAEFPTIKRNKVVDFTTNKGRTNYEYEDFDGIAKSVRPILSSHGLSFRFRTTSNANEPISVTCVISHESGHFEENTLTAARDESGNKNSIQAIASTVTYLQRYTLKAALGLSVGDADDDGQGADGTITPDQMGILSGLISATDTAIEKFCAAMKIDSLAAMPAKQFNAAKAMLDAKARKQAEAEDASN